MFWDHFFRRRHCRREKKQYYIIMYIYNIPDSRCVSYRVCSNCWLTLSFFNIFRLIFTWFFFLVQTDTCHHESHAVASLPPVPQSTLLSSFYYLLASRAFIESTDSWWAVMASLTLDFFLSRSLARVRVRVRGGKHVQCSFLFSIHCLLCFCCCCSLFMRIVGVVLLVLGAFVFIVVISTVAARDCQCDYIIISFLFRLIWKWQCWI